MRRTRRNPVPVTQTEAFRRWFGDSEVVDENGEPLVVWHGTDKSFDVFKTRSKSVNSTTFGPLETERSGIFVSDNPEFSREFGSRLLSLYARIENPAEISAAGSGVGRDPALDFAETIDAFTERDLWLQAKHVSRPWQLFDGQLGPRFIAYLQELGYDGATFIEDVPKGDDVGEDEQEYVEGRTYVVFDPRQVKSATDNDGTFDVDDPDLRSNPDDEAHEDDLPPLVEDADYHRIYDADDFYWDVGYHWTSRAKAEKVLRDGFFAPLHFFEGHESGPIYAGVISSEAAREVDRIMRKKFGPDLVLGNATFDYFADVLSNVVKKHHPEWNRIWYGKHPDDSSSYGDTCLRIDLRGIGAWISETGRDAIETEDYTYGNGLFVDAKIPTEFFSVYEGDEEGRSNPDARITEEEARKKMKGEQGVFRALDQGARGICTAFEYPDGGVYALHRRRDGKIQGLYHHPPREWEAPRAFVDESPFAPRRNPRVGKMMEAFADLLKTKEDRDPPRPFIEDGKARIDLTYGKRDYEGDLELDILRLKVGRSFVAAAAGELGSRVFAEHNTFTAPKHRGKGYMHLLYTTLLKDGIGIVSDKWNHSLPMRKVWMRLARDGWPVYAFTDEGEDVGGETMTLVPPDVTQDDPLLDEVLVVAPNMDAFSRIFDEYELDEGVGEHLRGGADSVYEGDENEDD